MAMDQDRSEQTESKNEGKGKTKPKRTAKTFRAMRASSKSTVVPLENATEEKKSKGRKKAATKTTEAVAEEAPKRTVRAARSTSAKKASDDKDKEKNTEIRGERRGSMAKRSVLKRPDATPLRAPRRVSGQKEASAEEDERELLSTAHVSQDQAEADQTNDGQPQENSAPDPSDAAKKNDPEAFPVMSRSERFGTRMKVVIRWLLRKLWTRIKNIQMTDTRMIAFSVAGVMLVGTLLLCTPWASASGEWTSFVDALFTATTATCVTGLVTVTTAAHWSLFGQIVILILIQVGGIGFMTVLTLVSFFMHRQITMHERRLLQQSVGSIHRSGVSGTFAQILLGTFVIETVGAILLSLRFYPMYGKKGIWYAVFHSVSAFCNAGIDLLSVEGTSLIAFADDYLVTGTVMFLVIMGGLGFLVWNDILRCGVRFGKMKLHSKMVLTLTFSLILGGAVLLMLTDWNAAFAGMPFGQKVWTALFQSITLRTAGFATVDQALLSNSGAMICLVLMFIGGSPGSTAGGVKTTTVAVFFFSILRLSRNREDVVLFKRRIYNRIVRQAGAVVGVYLGMVLVATVLICALEPLGIREVLFEVVSAVATVGLSMNITPTFCTASKLILIVLMYAGRLGGLSLFLALGERTEAAALERPTEKILIG